MEEKNWRTLLVAAMLVTLTAIASTNLTATYAQTTSATYYVALDGSGDFKDIQSAINAVPSGIKGIIVVKSGTYTLNPRLVGPYYSITVKSNLEIRGAGMDKTVVRSFPTRQPAGSATRAPTIISKTAIQNLVIANLTLTQNGTPDNKGSHTIDLRGGMNTNVHISNVKITYATGAGISIPRFSNLTVENCSTDTTWTGIILGSGDKCAIRNCRIVNTKGDGIFPRGLTTSNANLSITNLMIEGNYIANAGDTGIDVTSPKGFPPHQGITIRRNTIENAHIRVTNAANVLISDNFINNGVIDVDAGQAKAVNVTVQGNRITTSKTYAIGFYGVQDCRAINNDIRMTSGMGTQSGIHAAIRGVGLIEGNTIVGSKNYGISFAGWGLGGTVQLTIRNNSIVDFGSIGIWDDSKKQGPPLTIEDNTIWDSHAPFVSRFGIRTDYTTNDWTIRNNDVYAGTIAAISAPNSDLSRNSFAPP